MIPSTDDAHARKQINYMFERKEKYVNGILLFSVLTSICTGGFYRSPCPTDKPRKKSSVCKKRNVKLWLHFSLLACSLCFCFCFFISFAQKKNKQTNKQKERWQGHRNSCGQLQLARILNKNINKKY